MAACASDTAGSRYAIGEAVVLAGPTCTIASSSAAMRNARRERTCDPTATHSINEVNEDDAT